MIVEKVIEAKRQNQRVYPCRSNRASQLGHPCERYLVYMRTSWDKMTLPDVTREFIFEGGRFIENLALEQLKQAGFQISNQQRDFEDKKTQLTGHVDGYVTVEGEEIPIEIKGISPFEYDKLNTLEDMTHSRQPWVRSYPAQIQLYMYLSNKGKAVFYIVNKLTYVPKEIICSLDYDYCEELLKKAERINSHVDKCTLPEKLNDVDTCEKCPARAMCCPDIDFGTGVVEENDEAMTALLNVYFKLKPIASEFEKVNDNLKKLCKVKTPGEYILDNKYVVSISTQTRTSYELPPELKKQYETKKEYVITKFEEVKE